MNAQSKHRDLVEKVAAVAAEHARAVDADGRFPQEAIGALAKEGLFGLISATEVGGLGQGLRAAGEVVERLARACGSTAMVTCMHYSATAVLEKLGPESVRRDIAAGKHLSTLAFSEAGSRSQFWAPTSTARREAGGIRLDARKSWSTSAGHAQSYVWSSKPLEGNEASTIWLVPRGTPGVSVDRPFTGLGLRGNESSPITADGAVVPESAMLGKDGGGFGVMMEIVLPTFNVLNAACSLGLMEEGLTRAANHVAGTRFEHSNTSVADLGTVRAYLAKARVQIDMARGLWLDTLSAIESGRPDTMLRVLEVKPAANDAALAVLDTAMRVAGGAAFRNDVAIERYFRDTRAGAVMAPTSDQLYDFIGKAVTGLPLF